jgi:tape measure domain-containing protein
VALTVGELLVVIDARTAQFQTALTNVDRRVAAFGANTQRQTALASRAFTGMQGSVQGLSRLLGTLAVAFGVREIIGLVDEVTNLNNALTQVTTSAENLVGVQEELFDISQRTSTRVGDNANLFRRLSNATDKVGTSQKDLLSITETINQTVAVSGATSREATASLVQFSQALSGNFRTAGQEIASLEEQLPSLAKAISNNIGDGTKNLRELQKAGELTTAAVVAALQKAGPAIEAAFRKTIPTVENVFTTIRNSAVFAVSDIIKTLGGIGLTRGALADFGDTVRTELVQGFGNFARVLAAVVGILAEVSRTAESLGVTVSRVSQAASIMGNALIVGLRVIQLTVSLIRRLIEGIGDDFENAAKRIQDIPGATRRGFERLTQGTAEQSNDTLQESVGQLRSQVERLQEARRDVATQVGENFERSFTFQDLGRQLDTAKEKLDEASAELGRRGITIPIEVDAAQASEGLNEVLNLVNSPEFKALRDGVKIFDTDPEGNRQLTESLENVEKLLTKAAAAAENFKKQTGTISDEERAKAAQALADAQLEANEKLAALAQKIQEERLKAIDPILAELAAVDRQITAAKELATIATDQVAAEAVLNGLLTEQFVLQDRLARARESFGPAAKSLQTDLAKVGRIDPEVAARITKDLANALAKAEGSEERLQAIRDAAEKAGKFLEEAARDSRLGDALGEGLKAGLTDALSGSLNDFVPSFGAALRDSALDNLGDAFNQLISGPEGIGQQLAKALNVSGPVGSGILALGGALLSGLFGGDQIDSAAASVRSAVTSTQQTRGIVAGPTSIAVAEVGRSIKEAFTESERLLRLVERNTRLTAEAVGGTAAAGGAPSLAAGVLAFEAESTL